MDKPEVVTLCGSTKFKEQYIAENLRLTLEGVIVLSVGAFGQSDSDLQLTEEVKAELDELHKRKIDMSDRIYVLNVGGYIGSSTKSEIAYAEAHGIPVTYMECP